MGLIPDGGTKILHAAQCSQKNKEITHPIKINHSLFQGLLPSEMAHTLWSVFLPGPFLLLEMNHILSMECVSL